jgi:predicted RNA binding protein YcfA (HicA-like mRNA interferase family)
MTGLPLLKPMDVVKRLEKFGWKIARQKGSHIILTKDGHVATLSIPNHSEVARGTLRSLLARAGISIESFLKS